MKKNVSKKQLVLARETIKALDARAGAIFGGAPKFESLVGLSCNGPCRTDRCESNACSVYCTDGTVLCSVW